MFFKITDTDYIDEDTYFQEVELSFVPSNLEYQMTENTIRHNYYY